MVLQDKNTHWYYVINDSDLYWWDCYIFDEMKNPQDGYFPFVGNGSCREGYTQEEIEAEDELIRLFEEEWSQEETINYCLEQMGTSFKDCEILEDGFDGDLHEELMVLYD